MGIYEYACPVCGTHQRVKAQAGKVVEIEACAGCQAEGAEEELGELAAEVEEEVTAYQARSSAQKGKRR